MDSGMKKVQWLMKSLKWLSVTLIRQKNQKSNLVTSIRGRKKIGTTKLDLKKEKPSSMIMLGSPMSKSQTYSNLYSKCIKWATKIPTSNSISCPTNHTITTLISPT